MSEPTSGDSLNPALLLDSKATEIDETLKDQGDTTDEAPNGVVPPAKADEPVVSPEKVEAPTTEPNTSQPDIRKVEETAHLAALSHIETIMNDKYSKEEQKEFFIEHPELANVANRSKKFKDQYRALSKEEPVKVEPTKDPVKQEKNEELVDSLSDQVVAKSAEKQLISDRKAISRGYAERNGLNNEQHAQLESSAEALYKATDSITFEDALTASISLLSKSNDKTVNIPSGSNGDNLTAPKTADSEVKRIMQMHSVDKVLAEKLYNHDQIQTKQNVDFGLGKEIPIIMDY